MSVPIKATMEKVPGGMMLIPLLIGALLGTFAPDSAKFFGSFTGALFTGGTTILAVFFVPAFFVFVLTLMRTKRPVTEHQEHQEPPPQAPQTHSS